MLMKKTKFYINTTKKKETHFLICSFLNESGLSSKIEYVNFKQQFFQFFLLSKNIKSVNLRLKISKHKFKRLSDSAKLSGFYKAM
jgi:hypothetical protein